MIGARRGKLLPPPLRALSHQASMPFHHILSNSMSTSTLLAESGHPIRLASLHRCWLACPVPVPWPSSFAFFLSFFPLVRSFITPSPSSLPSPTLKVAASCEPPGRSDPIHPLSRLCASGVLSLFPSLLCCVLYFVLCVPGTESVRSLITPSTCRLGTHYLPTVYYRRIALSASFST